MRIVPVEGWTARPGTAPPTLRLKPEGELADRSTV